MWAIAPCPLSTTVDIIGNYGLFDVAEGGRDTIDSLGGSALDGNTLQVEWVWCMRHRQTSYPSSSPRRDTRTNAHLALKHMKHDPSKGPKDLGRKREVVVPWSMHLVVKLYQLFPGLVEWGILRMARNKP